MNINRYTEFVNEYYNRSHEGRKTRTELLTKEEFIEIFKKNCKNFVIDKSTYLYRGSNDAGDYLLIDPSKYSRGSIEDVNVHTFLMDNMPEWSEFPKRSKSVISSTNTYEAGGFGGEKYIVIPFDMSPIGISPDSDVWVSFENGEVVSHYNEFSGESPLYGYGDDSLFKIMDHFLRKSGLDLHMNHKKEYSIDYDTFLSFFEHEFNIDKFGKTERELEDYRMLKLIKFTLGIRNLQDITGSDVLEFIRRAFNPDYNGFKAKKYRKNFSIKSNSYSNSVWIGGKCLLIKERNFIEIKDSLK